METIPEQRLFDAIKNDDVKLFSSLIAEDGSRLFLRYGRFSVEALVLLYDANKIYRAYAKAFKNVVNYVETDEIVEAYEKFKSYAGKSLRLYLHGKAVTPLEILAVKDDGAAIKALYAKASKTPETVENIEKIYELTHKKRVVQSGDSINFKKVRFSLWQKITLPIVVLLVAAMIFLPFKINSYVSGIFGGDGSEASPINLSNSLQFKQALKNGEGRYFRITEDIIIEDGWEKVDFDGYILGENRTLTVNGEVNNGFIGNLKGKIENLKVVFKDIKKDVAEDFGYFVKTNRGDIINVEIALNADLTDTLSDNDVYCGIMTMENAGEIMNSVVKGNVSLKGNGSGEFYFGVIAAKNNGQIINCRTEKDSSVTSETVDIAGICSLNEANGSISSCVNYASLSQINDQFEWTPNVAGVSVSNKGTISKCTNEGKITSESSTTNDKRGVYAAGIVCTNEGSISDCKNVAEIFGNANASVVFSGGISVENVSQIKNCTNEGKITSTAAAAIVYAGGISAKNSAQILSCQNSGVIFSTAGLSSDAKKELHAGGITAINESEIKECKNQADVGTVTDGFASYAGGISSYGSYYSLVNNCCSYGKITASARDEKGLFIFLGGIVGGCDGSVEKSYAASTFNAVGGESFIGGIFGLANGNNARSLNNYYIGRENVTLGVGTILQSDFFGNNYLYDGVDSGTTKLADEEELKSLEVYWG